MAHHRWCCFGGLGLRQHTGERGRDRTCRHPPAPPRFPDSRASARPALPRRGGDLAVNLCAAFPLLVITVEGYTQVHLAHHKYYFTANDPDFVRKSGADWAIPMASSRLLWLF